MCTTLKRRPDSKNNGTGPFIVKTKKMKLVSIHTVISWGKLQVILITLIKFVLISVGLTLIKFVFISVGLTLIKFVLISVGLAHSTSGSVSVFVDYHQAQ